MTTTRPRNHPRPGTPGASALAMYRRTRRRRRIRTLTGVCLLGGAGAAVPSAVAAGSLQKWPAVVALLLAAAGVLFVATASMGGLRDADRWRRGAKGEMRTAEMLDALSSRRWAVWHDLRVPSSRANIDHLVVGRTGLWVVDTKAPRGAVRPGWRSVRLGDRKLDTAPVRWEAEMVEARIQAVAGDSLDCPVTVRPIVAVHGEGLKSRGVRVEGVRVVPAERLVRRLRKGRTRLSRRDRAVLIRVVDEAFG